MVVLRRGADDARSAGDPKLDGECPDTTGSRMYEQSLTGNDPELFEHCPRRAARPRQARRYLPRDVVRLGNERCWIGEGGLSECWRQRGAEDLVTNVEGHDAPDLSGA